VEVSKVAKFKVQIVFEYTAENILLANDHAILEELRKHQHELMENPQVFDVTVKAVKEIIED